MKIAIAGGIATGKSTLASNISKTFSIPKISFSDVLRNYCKRNKIEITREVLQDLGKSLIDEKGYNGFFKFIVKESRDMIDWDKDFVMEGFRHPEIYKAFHEMFPDSKLIFCQCTREEQIRRIKFRDKIDDGAVEKILDHPVEKEIQKLFFFKNFLYSQSTKQEELFEKISKKNVLY